MPYTVLQFILDNYTSAKYYPGIDCARCGNPVKETVEGVPFCGRHLAIVNRKVGEFRKEEKRLEKWNEDAGRMIRRTIKNEEI